MGRIPLRLIALVLAFAALLGAWAVLAAIADDDREAGGRLAGVAGGAPWPRLELDRDQHARRYAARLGLSDGQGGVFTDLLDRDAWVAIDGEVAQSRAGDRLRGRLRWQAPAAVALLVIAAATAIALAWSQRRRAGWLALAGLLLIGAGVGLGWAARLGIAAASAAAWR